MASFRGVLSAFEFGKFILESARWVLLPAAGLFPSMLSINELLIPALLPAAAPEKTPMAGGGDLGCVERSINGASTERFVPAGDTLATTVRPAEDMAAAPARSVGPLGMDSTVERQCSYAASCGSPATSVAGFATCISVPFMLALEENRCDACPVLSSFGCCDKKGEKEARDAWVELELRGA